MKDIERIKKGNFDDETSFLEDFYNLFRNELDGRMLVGSAVRSGKFFRKWTGKS